MQHLLPGRCARTEHCRWPVRRFSLNISGLEVPVLMITNRWAYVSEGIGFAEFLRAKPLSFGLHAQSMCVSILQDSQRNISRLLKDTPFAVSSFRC